jgi:hypothetical protein
MPRRCWTGIEWLVLRCRKFVMKRPLSDLRHARQEEDMASKPRARHRGSGRIVGAIGPPGITSGCAVIHSLRENKAKIALRRGGARDWAPFPRVGETPASARPL